VCIRQLGGVSEKACGLRRPAGVDILRQRTQKEIAKRSCTHALEATSGAPASRESSSAMEERRRVAYGPGSLHSE